MSPAESDTDHKDGGDTESADSRSAEPQPRAADVSTSEKRNPRRKTVLKWAVSIIVLMLVLAVVAAALDAQSSGSDDYSASQESDSAEARLPDYPQGAGDTPGDYSQGTSSESREISGGADLYPPGGGSVPDAEQRYIISTATAVIGIELDEMDATVRSAEDIVVDRHEGIVESRDERYSPYEGDIVTTRLTFRVPSENYAEALAEISDLGEVEQVNENSDDVTGTVVEIDARIENAEASLERLRDFMEEAESVEDLMSVEQQLQQRQADLEVMLAQREHLENKSEMSTINVVFEAEVDRASAAEEDPFQPREFEPNGFVDGMERGWSAAVVLANTLIAGLGLILPWSPLLLVAAVVVWLHVRKRKRRKEAEAVIE